ncbi:ABC transporter ATP-binding protein [Amycolatopsis thermalba]|uniref:ABC transporter ATP-binding protein n=1 Tax=Amycolatopsis thermalba TaxID=944492 RepID=A0ABY4NWL8_9PSEU|nr:MULTISPECIES: ABC transporter ATP-binding protein [Amycolatopsis]UQS24479.1 ABC transporter ATP-binding protein [Amycolatopsis thermalba]
MDLALDSVTVEVAGRRLVDALSLKAGDGEVVGLVGPNGSGKSTALRCVYRALAPSSGAVLVGGTDLSGLSTRDSARVVAAVTQEAGSDLDFTVAEIVAMGRFPHHPGNRALSEREHDLVRRCLERTGVAHLAGRGIQSLSGGERQRVLIARALAQEPRILVLDEPTNHLDVRHQVELLSFLRTCGLTVLVALHDLNLAAATCDRVAVLHEGELAAAGPPGEVLTPELVRRVFGVTPVLVTHPVTGVPQLLWTFTDRGGSP